MRRPRFDRERVLDSAIEIFWRDGYAATSLANLLEEMGISRQSLYNCFGDKHSLFLAALDRYMERKSRETLGVLESPDAGLASVEAFFEHAFARARATQAERRACMIGKTAMELASDDAEVAERLRRYGDRMISAFRNALTNAMARGEIAPCDCEGRATQLAATAQGLGMLYRAGVPEPRIEAAVQATLACLRDGPLTTPR